MMDIKSDNTFCIGQTFNTWEEFQAVFDEHCKTANAKYRLADCKYSSTANRKIPEGSEGLFNEAHRYAYAKFTCALTPHVKQKRVPENEEENENSESHIDCGAHIYIMSDRKADKLIIKDLNLDHDHEEKSPSVQRERRRKRFSYAHMSRPAPEIEKPKKKPKLSSAVKQHKETAAKNCSVVVNVNGNKTNEKEILVEKHKKMMNLCMELWETSIECSDEEFSERFMFLKSILSWWKCGARPASYSNMGNDVNGSLFIKENTDVTNGELDAHLIVEATAEECLL